MKRKHSILSESSHNSDDDYDEVAREVADHYSNRTNQTYEQRQASPIILLRDLNNWIKSVLIHLYAKRGDAVLDFACGKGGDLSKWNYARIGSYVGVDIAKGSIEDFRIRYNRTANYNRGKGYYTVPAKLLSGDCFEVRLDKALANDAPFDLCSCQFAIHYSWSTEARARRALANVSSLLRPGGMFIGTMPDANVIVNKLRAADGLKFGNGIYWIQFDDKFSEKKFKSSSPFGIKYKFHLEDAVDCPEWIVPFHVFKSLAEEYDMELVSVKNSHAFVHEYIKYDKFLNLMRNKKRKHDPLYDEEEYQSILSPELWEVANLYLEFAFRKRGRPEQNRGNRRTHKGKMYIEKRDIGYI